MPRKSKRELVLPARKDALIPVFVQKMVRQKPAASVPLRDKLRELGTVEFVNGEPTAVTDNGADTGFMIEYAKTMSLKKQRAIVLCWSNSGHRAVAMHGKLFGMGILKA